MRIGLLVCDHLTAELQAAAGGRYYDLYRRWLESADPDVEVVEYDAVSGELPASVRECEGWVVTGSHFDAFADEPWLDDLKEFLRKADVEQARLVGICFGHQLVAEALGGEVGRAQEGWKVGPQAMVMTPQPWFAGGPISLSAMHRDVVTRLPDGATVIAEGTTAEIPAYLIGEHILTIQDHPEFTAEFAEALIRSRADRLGPDVIDDALRRLAEIKTDGRTVAQWALDFLADRRIK